MKYSGYRYLKSGDSSGDLCIECGRELYLQKGVLEVTKTKSGKERKRRIWELRCYCGHTTAFMGNDKYTSAYK